MTDATRLANIRKALTDEWKLLLPFIRDTPTFAHRRDRHDAAVMALDELEKRHGQPTTATEQPALVALPMPELDKDLSLKVDQLDKQIDHAKTAGQFARVSGLVARKQQILRAAGL